MPLYKLTFDNIKKMVTEGKNLDEAHDTIVKYMETKPYNKCEILCPNGIKRTVIKTGQYHWKYDGYSFS